ncbi:MAG: hypothetical protein ACLRPU_00655 [Enterococcus hulanensis]
MKKKYFVITLVGLLSVILFAGCGSKNDLKEMLTEGSGRWEMSTPKGGGNIEFFEDGSAKLNDDGDIEKMTYTINEEQTSLTLVMEDYEDVKSTIKNIKIEDEQTIKGDLFQNDDSESAPIKLVK